MKKIKGKLVIVVSILGALIAGAVWSDKILPHLEKIPGLGGLIKD